MERQLRWIYPRTEGNFHRTLEALYRENQGTEHTIDCKDSYYCRTGGEPQGVPPGFASAIIEVGGISEPRLGVT